MRPTFRTFFALGFMACAGALAFAYYLQYGRGLQPCPLCIFQRVAMAFTGLMFLIGALHGPLEKGRWGYAALTWIGCAAGVALAARHIWIQSLPPDQIPVCGPGLRYMLQVMPLHKVFAAVLEGDGECATVNWRLLGLSLPVWTLIGFVLLAVWAALPLRFAPRKIRYHSNL